MAATKQHSAEPRYRVAVPRLAIHPASGPSRSWSQGQEVSRADLGDQATPLLASGAVVEVRDGDERG